MQPHSNAQPSHGQSQAHPPGRRANTRSLRGQRDFTQLRDPDVGVLRYAWPIRETEDRLNPCAWPFMELVFGPLMRADGGRPSVFPTRICVVLARPIASVTFRP